MRLHTLTGWVTGTLHSPTRPEWRRQGRGAAGKWRQNWRIKSQVGWQAGPNRPALGPRRAAAKPAAKAEDSMCARGRNREREGAGA
jgi:hypothetical protein